MKFVDEFRDKVLIEKLIEKLKGFSKRNYTFMEVCGGHTFAIHRFGLPTLLPENFRLISGPGCPVCVTGKSFIDKVIAYSKIKNFIITTFGDLIRIPGSRSSLEKEKSAGADIRIVFSPLDAIDIAAGESEKKVVFPGIGFETTAPGTAVAVKETANRRISNFFILSAHKIMPPAMEAIVTGGTLIDGFICPGHVSTVTGSFIYDFIPRMYGIGCVVAGFEPVDLLQAILMLAIQVEKGKPSVEIQYRRAVTHSGNILAQKQMHGVFQVTDEYWRGFGVIPRSGLKLREEYSCFDIEKVYPLPENGSEKEEGCICGDILKGLKTPPDCKLFAEICEPANPVGACMVSNEGTCHTYYIHRNND